MKKFFKALLVCLLAAVMVLPLVACTQNGTDTSNPLRDAMSDKDNSALYDSLYKSVVMDVPTYHDYDYAPIYDPSSGMPIVLDDIFDQILFNDMSKLDSVKEINDAVTSIKNALDARETLGAQLYTGAVRGITTAITKYVLKIAVNSLLDAFGVDTRSDTEKILDKLDMLDEMSEKLNQINDIVTDLCASVKVDAAKKLMDDRNEALTALNLTTQTSYKAVFDYLTDGYAEYMNKYQQLMSLLDEENYSGDDPLVTKEYFDTVTAGFDKEFMNTYLYMQNCAGYTAVQGMNYENNSLAVYMGYRLDQVELDSTDKATQAFLSLINTWGTTDVMGNPAAYETELLMKRYCGGYAVLYNMNMTFPEVYDYVVNYDNAWEHEGYGLREALRIQDANIIDQAYFMAQLYLGIYGNPLTVADERATLDKLMTNYSKVLDEHPVVHHDDYYICIIPGCEYVFAKNLIFYDYYSGLNTVKDIQVFNNDQEPLRAEANTAYNNLFYSSAITYDYYKLSDDDKSKLTYNHSAIGAADNPVSKLDTSSIKDVSTLSSKTYLSIDAYKTLLGYYRSKYEMPAITLNDVIEALFGVKLPDNACIVADPDSVNLSKVGQYDLGFSNDIYYVGPFKMKIANQSCDGDDIAVRSVIKCDATGTDETRFVNDCNIKAGNGKITAMGSPVFRFFGLQLVGTYNG